MHNERGHELPDQTPVSLPVGFKPPPSMVEMIRMHIRRELSQAAQQQGAETFEEADDFDVDDDPPDPRTPYEAVFDPPPQKPDPAPAGPAPAPAPSTPSVPEASSS